MWCVADRRVSLFVGCCTLMCVRCLPFVGCCVLLFVVA